MCQIQRAIKCFVSISLKSSPRKKWLREIERVIYQTLLPIIQTTVSINEQLQLWELQFLAWWIEPNVSISRPYKKLNNLWAFLDNLTFRSHKIGNMIKIMSILYQILYFVFLCSYTTFLCLNQCISISIQELKAWPNSTQSPVKHK